MRESDIKVITFKAIGFYGFYAGPEVHIIDEFALGDPLLARMEIPDKKRWRVGHFTRRLPEGYIDTVKTGENMIKDPKIQELYSVLEIITKDKIWSMNRFKEIIKINSGSYNDLHNQY